MKMQQMLRAMGQKDIPATKPTLEINPDHEIVKKLAGDQDEKVVEDAAWLLLDQALLMEGVAAPGSRLIRAAAQPRFESRDLIRASGPDEFWNGELHDRFDGLVQFVDVKRLGQISVHSPLEAPFPVAQHGACRHGDDRKVPSLVLACTNRGRGFQSVHVRHLHVHKNKIEITLLNGLQGHLAIFGKNHGVSSLFQESHGDNLVYAIIFSKQDG